MLWERILQQLIEAEATEAIGAAPREHSDQRTTWRNGHRERLLTTQAGDLDLKIPKVRTGSSSPRCWSGAGASTGPCSPW
jgi:transposase-like protein